MRARSTLPFAAALASALLAAVSARAANDPRLLWQTIETAHFRVHFESQARPVAEYVADLAEDVHTRLSPAVGWSPGEKTELLLSDQTDSANGSAGALPYNAVRLNITAPDDMSPLGDAEDWYLELVTHEYTHILHTDHIVGVPAIVNAVVGKTMSTNQVQPRWALEGLAIFEESARTSGGRLRNSMWNMYMRADVMEDNVAPLDVFSNPVRRWPQGNIWYLYGSFFMRWIAETYGEGAIRKMIDDYGRQIIPYGINRSIKRATGRTYEELYPAWIATLRKIYGEEVAEVKRRGVREGVRLTTGGNTARHPRWIPKGTFEGHAGDLLYMRDDGRSTPGLYALPITRDARGNVTRWREKDRELLVRVSGESATSFLPDGGIVFNSVDQYNNLFYFDDLFRAARGATSPSGMDGKTTRLTEGFRAVEPDVSPDGRRVAFTTNHRGTIYLQVATLTKDGVEDVTNLVPPERPFDLAFTPRWSPDNVHLAYSAWTHGGFRDIRIVDTRTGKFTEIAHDRAVDGDPSWSHDGRFVFFHSDRTGISNIYAYEVATGALKQVTNVTTGAYQPEPSPDGKTLAYIGFTHEGFDLYAMALDESQWLDVLPYDDDRPPITPPPRHHDYVVKEYNPLPTLYPRRYSINVAPGNFGQAVTLGVAGADIVGHHAYAATLTTELENPVVQGSVSYTYGRLPVDLSISGYRTIQPRGGLQLGQAAKPAWVSETVGLSTGVGYTMPRQFDSQSFSLSYSLARLGGDLPLSNGSFDPYETPQIPNRGLVGFVHLGWSYSNAQSYLWSVANEQGFGASANFDFTNPWLGSEYSGFSTSANLSWYYPMPWLRHHTLGLHAGAGTSGGSYPGAGAFYIGGFVDLPVLDTVRSTLIQGGIVLRGYPVVAEAGRSYALFNGEYRFPIANIERGPSTLPFFLNRINGAVFVDYGSAFDDAYTAKFKTGVGGELWFDFTLGYVATFTFRAGFARGLASGGVDKPYFVAAVPF